MTDVEREFVGQADTFVAAAVAMLGASSVDDCPNHTAGWATAVSPIVVRDYKSIAHSEREAIREAYYSRDGVAYLMVVNGDEAPRSTHPLFDIAEQLNRELPFAYPLPHPQEGHREAVARFGPADGTVKVYDLPKPASAGYREQGETSEAFDVHHDGLGSAGAVESFILYCDEPPLCGGFTYFQNMCALGVELARTDIEAFRSLFLPDALRITRPRGRGAIRVTTPVLYVNEAGRPQSAYRRASGEYLIEWRSDPPLTRAREFFDKYTQPFAPGSTFIQFSARGHCCIARNEVVAHGRTAFIDWTDGPMRRRRCLSRKWFMRRPEDAVYKHVPGMLVAPLYAAMFPSLFGPEVVEGEWNLDEVTSQNVRIDLTAAG